MAKKKYKWNLLMFILGLSFGIIMVGLFGDRETTSGITSTINKCDFQDGTIYISGNCNTVERYIDLYEWKQDLSEWEKELSELDYNTFTDEELNNHCRNYFIKDVKCLLQFEDD